VELGVDAPDATDKQLPDDRMGLPVLVNRPFALTEKSSRLHEGVTPHRRFHNPPFPARHPFPGYPAPTFRREIDYPLK